MSTAVSSLLLVCSCRRKLFSFLVKVLLSQIIQAVLALQLPGLTNPWVDLEEDTSHLQHLREALPLVPRDKGRRLVAGLQSLGCDEAHRWHAARDLSRMD